MSDRKASIHILRGTGDNMIYKIPEAGQPLYDKGNHILYIGDGETSPDEGLPPVTVHDLAITTSKLRDKAVTKEKMAANSVDTLQLVDNSVKGNKIDAAAISMAKLDLTDAGYSNYFVLTSQKQTISGEKTFGDTAIFSDGIGVDGAISDRKSVV